MNQLLSMMNGVQQLWSTFCKMTSMNAMALMASLLVCNNCRQVSKKSNLTLISAPVPTEEPLIFAPGIISKIGTIESSITFSPDMTELYFNRREPGESHNIHTMKLTEDKWSEPALASFSTNRAFLDFHPRFSPNGDRLYFGSTRPTGGTNESTGLHQWYVEMKENGWGQPISMEAPFMNRFIMCTTPSENGNLYFTSKESEDKLEDEGIYYAINQDGDYNTVQKMGMEINHPGKWIAHPFIAADESYVIYDAERTTAHENGDLYISFNKNGAWTKSYSLGPEINTQLSEGAATVSPNGHYLFFSRGEERVREDGSTYWTGDLYWVDFIRLKEKIEHAISN